MNLPHETIIITAMIGKIVDDMSSLAGCIAKKRPSLPDATLNLVQASAECTVCRAIIDKGKFEVHMHQVHGHEKEQDAHHITK
jgi:hypothetical protein